MKKNFKVEYEYFSTDPFKYFHDGIERNEVGRELFPFGTMWQAYHGILDGLLFYHEILKAYVMANIQDKSEWFDIIENRTYDIDLHNRIPKNIIVDRYNGTFIGDNPQISSSTYRFYYLDSLFNVLVDYQPMTKMHEFGMDVIILGRNEGELYRDEYAIFWYDISSAYSNLGRFKTDDSQEEVIDQFNIFCKTRSYIEECPEALREIPLHYFKKPFIEW